MLKHLDLCSGIGGFAVGFSMAKLSEPIAFCDTDKFCQKVLAKNFPGIPIPRESYSQLQKSMVVEGIHL